MDIDEQGDEAEQLIYNYSHEKKKKKPASLSGVKAKSDGDVTKRYIAHV